MSVADKLIGFGFRQVIGAVAGDETGEMAGDVAASVMQIVQKHLSDHSQTLPKALARANDRTWQALVIALAGDGFLDQVKVFFASGDDKGIREQVRLFLEDNKIAFEGTSADFRRICLAELRAARKDGWLSAKSLSPYEIARHTSGFKRYSDPKGLVDGAHQVVSQIANSLGADYPNLGQLLQLDTGGRTPLIVSAFAYFFRREVETNDEMAHGLFFDGLRQLSATQAKAFGQMGKALDSLSDHFDKVFDQLDRIEKVLVDAHTVTIETQSAVLDMQAELQRLEGLQLSNADEIRRLFQEVLNRITLAGMPKGEVKPHHSFSIRSEEERAAVKQLLTRFRQLPTQQQRQVPALLNALGKLQFGSQDFEGARKTFVEVVEDVRDSAAQAEAQFNAYRAALEQKLWDDALASIQKAATLDSPRYAPFPMQRYQPKQLLGAGGFGAAFLCHDRNFDEAVVVKTLHDGEMERNMSEVFREARLLRKLNHPSIIGVHECEYADPGKYARPYIVMDYFPGGSLATFIQEHGVISPEVMMEITRQVADGMQAAHQQNILHRDLKPDNVLVRKEGSSWKVKIIDFGLALRKSTIETSLAAGMAGTTILGDSVAGTIEYAPPEQLGKLKGVQPGPYSDVYAFGKMCCYALFKTTEPKNRHWVVIPKELHELLESCTEQELQHRLPNFEPVLKAIESLKGTRRNEETPQASVPETNPHQGQIEDKKEQEELLWQRHEQEQEMWGQYKDEGRRHADRQRKALESYEEGEVKLARYFRDTMDRTQGKPTKEDTPAAADICKLHRIPKERVNQIFEIAKEQWLKAENLRLWRETDEARIWVDTFQGAWNHDDWLSLVDKLKRSRYWPMELSAIGEVVEQTKQEWIRTKRQEEIHGLERKRRKLERTPGESVTNYLGMKFAWVPPGTFLMGSSKYEHGRCGNEPQHKVILTRGYYIGVYAVTQAEWQVLVGNNPSRFRGKNNLPVEQVSWDDCQEFIKKLRRGDKKPYRLPTEAEWEYACRAGTTMPFSFGTSINAEQANIRVGGIVEAVKWIVGLQTQKTMPVGKFSPNSFGLFDMHGNVWEWCQDWYGDYPTHEVADPQGPGAGIERVLRGGSFMDESSYCRAAYRNKNLPGHRSSNIGFRLCFFDEEIPNP